MINNLPIHHIREEFTRILKTGNRLILHAPTGSGKSTQVPQYLVDDILPKNRKVIILQPRRIATRMLAKYVASDRNCPLGSEVGYQVRLEGQFSKNTRILFLTEGILLQQLLHNDVLEDTGALVFDEFHERHIETDLCLAMAIALQKKSRPDLKIVVMSATLETNALQKYLNDCPIIKTDGKAFPVTIRYAQPKPYETLWDFAALQLDLAKDLLSDGSALIFMPGAFEIRKTIDAIQKRQSLQSYEVLPLYGSLTKDEQDKAVLPGKHKIIVSTNVAETSLTIPDIKLVIDCGVARVARFDPHRGINTLFTEAISKSSANQRAGRAGRTSSGVCIRLWSEFSHANRPDNDTPEIYRIDLSEILLGLMASGIASIQSFPWFESPDQKTIERSMEVLQNMGAIDNQNYITPIGKKMACFAQHPRFSRMLVESEKEGCIELACVLAAITQSQGLFFTTNDEIILNNRLQQCGDTSSDLIFELKAWLWTGERQYKASECSYLGINTAIARQIGQLAVQLIHVAEKLFPDKKKKIPHSITVEEELHLRKCIFAGFSDYLAIRHRLNSPICQMIHGRSAQLKRDSIVQEASFLVATELEETKTSTGKQILLKKVTAIDESWLLELHNNAIEKKQDIRFDATSKKVLKYTEWVWNKLLLKREIAEADSPDDITRIFTEEILNNNIEFTQWNDDVQHFVRRVNFAAKHAPHYEIPAIDEEAKEFIIQQAIYGCKTIKEIQRCNIWPALKDWLSYEQKSAVDLVSPETINLPHRYKPVKLCYDEKGDVILSETIQALYDCPLPITVAEGKVAVIFELLSPARRPVQITRDLDYFWKNSYHEIKKELKGRYPKHEWR